MKAIACVLAAVLTLALAFSVAQAQGGAKKQVVMELRAAVTRDRSALSHYAWQQLQTVTLDGTVRTKTVFRVQLGSNGKPQRTQSSMETPGGALSAQDQAFGKQLVELAQKYAPLDPSRLQALAAQNNVDVLDTGAQGVDQLTIDNYAKKGDAVTVNFNRAKKSVVSMIVATYLTSPDDYVGIAIQCSKLDDGTWHPSTVAADVDSKKLTVLLENSDYKKR